LLEESSSDEEGAKKTPGDDEDSDEMFDDTWAEVDLDDGPTLRESDFEIDGGDHQF